MTLPIEPQPWYVEHARIVLALPLVWMVVRYRDALEFAALAVVVAIAIAAEKVTSAFGGDSVE